MRWVIACILFASTVFAGEGAGDLVVSHVTETPRAPSELAPVPAAVDAVIARCLAKSLDDRFPTMRQLALEIDAASRQFAGSSSAGYLTPSPSQSSNDAPVGSAVTVADPRPATRRWPLLAGGAVLVLGAATAVAFALRGGETAPELAPPSTPAVPETAPPVAAPPPPTPTPSAPTSPAPTASPAPAEPPSRVPASIPAKTRPRPVPRSHAAPVEVPSAQPPPDAPAARPPRDPYEDR